MAKTKELSDPHVGVRTWVVVDASGITVNSLLWNGDPGHWQPPPGCKAYPYDGVWHDGWKWDAKKKIAFDPNPPPPEPPPPANPKGMKVI